MEKLSKFYRHGKGDRIMKKRVITILILLVLILCFVWINFSSSSNELLSTTVNEGRFVQTLDLEGELRAVESKVINAPIPLRGWGQLELIYLINDGSFVKKGDILAKFDTKDIEKDIANFKTEIAKEELRLHKNQVELDQQIDDIKKEVDQTKLRKNSILLEVTDSESIPRITRETKKIESDIAEISVQKVMGKLEAKIKSAQDDLSTIRLSIEKIRKDLSLAKKALESYTLLSPNDGMIILETVSRYNAEKIRAGATIYSGAPILKIPQLTQMELLCYVHEADISKIRLSQPVSIRLDAFSEPSFEGSVKSIASLAITRDAKLPVKEFEVIVSIKKPAEFMKPGMSAKVSIIMDSRDSVISVPIEAVFQENEKLYVYKKDRWNYHRQEVQVGLKNNSHVIITHGLQSGDTISLVHPDGIKSLKKKDSDTHTKKEKS